MRNLLLSLLFFTLTPAVLIGSLLMCFHLSHQDVLGAATEKKDAPFAFAALPTSENVFEGSATFSDKRIDNLHGFLTTYHSPLAPYADLFVSKADQYHIDYRLLPAIAMQETTLCKKTLKNAQFNCWGWGIYGKQITNFNSFTEAIDTISLYFAKKREKGIENLDEIGAIYNPSNHSNWKENVASFMTEIAL
ncbi:MAG TPA: hypothetical protein VF189_03450 [Patescibacteria group bacterium]